MAELLESILGRPLAEIQGAAAFSLIHFLAKNTDIMIDDDIKL